MKRIYIFSTLEIVPWGGSEQLWSDVALKLLGQGHMVMTNSLEWEQSPEKLLQIKAAGGFTTFRPNIHKGGGIADRVKNRVKAYNWRNAALGFDPDVILISEGGAFDNAILQHGEWLMSLGKPVYIISQFLLEYEYMPPQRRQFFTDYFARAQRVFFVSNRNKIVAEKTMARRLPNAEVIRNPIKLQATTASFPDIDVYKIAVVARLESDIKGYDLLFETFAQPQWKDRNYRVQIYGSGPHEEYIKDLVTFYQLEDRIIFKGFTKDVKQIWDENHILLLPSRGEGTPLSLLEANYCKRAAVVTDVGGSGEIVTEGVNGFVAEAAVTSCVANAMERAWLQRDKWEMMGLAAKEKIDKLYIKDAVDDFIEKII
ncbi:MAG TPA: glycosyltransferase family 4 protein [Flavipsychrobacter sp.]